MAEMLAEQEIVRRIREGEPLLATVDTGAFTIRIDRYVPAVFTAIHDGHGTREPFAGKLSVSETERRFEEDPLTGQLIDTFPVILKVHDSRYLYDLNRAPDRCIYDEAWGRRVWKKPLSPRERRLLTELHGGYYRVLTALLTCLEKRFSRCVLYDLHSYNHSRIEGDPPLFNIGTHFIDRSRFQPVLTHLEKQLQTIALPRVDNRAVCDEVFFGKGYQAEFMHRHHPRSLCVPLEVKKVFMDEASFAPYPLIFESLLGGLKQALSRNAAYFTGKMNAKRVKRTSFFAEESQDTLRKVDAALYRVARGLNTVPSINPVNLVHERKRFFAAKHQYRPDFHYRPLRLDPFALRTKLYGIPVDTIRDVSIRHLYRCTVDMLAGKLDLLAAVATDSFRFQSLRFYGRPAAEDLVRARFLVAAPAIPDEWREDEVDAAECAAAVARAIEAYALPGRVELTSRIAPRAMVNNARQTVLINRTSRFTPADIRALISHEVGVHLTTTVNGAGQELKIFRLGLPGCTETQEGLALVAEYLAGALTLRRLQQLAYRVLAVQSMLEESDFTATFRVLHDRHDLGEKEAFNLTVRVYRGGGLTKDCLYLSGFRKIFRLYRRGEDVRLLFSGKTAVEYLDTLREMRARGLVAPPRHVPVLDETAIATGGVLDYILHIFD